MRKSLIIVTLLVNLFIIPEAFAITCHDATNGIVNNSFLELYAGEKKSYQTFCTVTSETINGLSEYIAVQGSPPDNLNLTIRTGIDGTIIASSTLIKTDFTNTTSTLFTFTFEPVTLTGGTTYYIQNEIPANGEGTNRWNIYYKNTLNGYWYYNAGAWQSEIGEQNWTLNLSTSSASSTSSSTCYTGQCMFSSSTDSTIGTFFRYGIFSLILLGFFLVALLTYKFFIRK